MGREISCRKIYPRSGNYIRVQENISSFRKLYPCSKNYIRAQENISVFGIFLSKKHRFFKRRSKITLLFDTVALYFHRKRQSHIALES